MPKQPNLLDGDDVGTLLTSQMEGDEEGKAPLTCSQKIVKVRIKRGAGKMRREMKGEEGRKRNIPR